MSKKKRDEELPMPYGVSVAHITIADTVVVSSPAIIDFSVELPAPPSLSFDAYCSVKHTPELHKAGMLAYAKAHKTARATLAEWDNLFVNY